MTPEAWGADPRGAGRAALRWYRAHRRALPWRDPDTTAWGILVSEVMLQQTPVSRVLPVWEEWLGRWPTPASFAAAPVSEVLRAWGKLGYPRRALRLHETAQRITALHSGRVPSGLADLLALPGVGAYTARAVAAFAFGQRHGVVDTNVRRVIARALDGVADLPARPGEYQLAEALLPVTPSVAAETSAALMELGAMVCTAQAPKCAQCPLAARCLWVRLGKPALLIPVKAAQGYEGTDRQVRGTLLGRAQAASAPVPRAAFLDCGAPPEQARRALLGLLADGLLEESADGVGLPGTKAHSKDAGLR